MAGEPGLCTKCGGAEPRAGKSVWGRKCLAAKKRDLRQRARSQVSQESQVSRPETPPAGAPGPVCIGCRERDKRNEVLEAEVVYLKRQLAARVPSAGIQVEEFAGKGSRRPGSRPEDLGSPLDLISLAFAPSGTNGQRRQLCVRHRRQHCERCWGSPDA